MVLISKDRVHLKGRESEILCDFAMLSTTLQKRYNLTLSVMKSILEIVNDDLKCEAVPGEADREDQTRSIIFTRGRGIFDL